MRELYSDFKKLPIYGKMTALQKDFIHYLFNGGNILLTGPAGTGKSFCLKAVFDFLEINGYYYAKTAMTGVAALNIGGSTLHSWAGIGLAEEAAEQLVAVVRRHKQAKDKIKAVKTIFVDEISMASGQLIDKLDFVFRFFRKSNKPFGGIQMVFVGDFLQLPPVFKSWNAPIKEQFAFDAKAWKAARIYTISLTEIMRQDSSSQFAEMLCGIRVGDTSKIDLLKSRFDFKFPDDGIAPVKIFCKNVDVNSFNKAKLNLTSGSEKLYYSDDEGKPHHIEFFNKNCQAPQTLALKVGAQVMLLINHDTDAGLVNGSVGVVELMNNNGVTVRFANGQTSFIPPNKWELKEEVVGIDGKVKMKVIAYRKQIPLKLAWATTVHKQQGSTIDRAEIDITEAFACGQVYVALSRVRDLESLSVKPFDQSTITVNDRCLEFYKGGVEL